jgi:hypothetical protein
MEQDNTLGAPTEGLGQTPTFVPQVDAAPSIGGAGDPGRSRAQVLGGFGPAVRPAQFMPSETGSPTAQFIAKTLARTGEAYSKDAQTRNFLTGVQRAMAGEAVEDIAADQPWYSRIFGEADVVAGARAYKQEANVQNLFAGFEREMPNLRQLSVEDANKFYSERLQASMTGHTATDAAIASSFMRSLPMFEKTRVKEQYAFMQQTAAAAQSEAVLSAAARVQTAAESWQRGTMATEDYLTVEAEVADIATGAQGQPLESWQTQRLQDFKFLAESGQFHALNSFEKLGIVQNLTAAQQAEYTRVREANEAQHRVRLGKDYIGALYSLKNDAERPQEGWGVEETIAKAEAINTSYKLRFGVKGDLIPPELVASYGERTQQAIDAVKAHNADVLARTTKARTDGLDEAAARQVALAGISELLVTGNLNKARLAASQIKGVASDDVDMLQLEIAKGVLADPTSKEAVRGFDMIANIGTSDQTIAPSLRESLVRVANASVVEGKPTPAFDVAYAQWRGINSRSPVAAAKVYGDLHDRFKRYSMLAPDGMAGSKGVTAAFDSSFGVNSKAKPRSFSKEETSAWLGAAISNLTFWNPAQYDLRPSQKEHLQRVLEPFAAAHTATVNMVELGDLALASARASGLQVYGGYAWMANNPNEGTFRSRVQGVRKDVTIPEGTEFDQYLADFIADRAKSVGSERDPLIVDYGDYLVLTSVDKNNRPVEVRMAVPEIANVVATKVLAQREKARPEAYRKIKENRKNAMRNLPGTTK